MTPSAGCRNRRSWIKTYRYAREQRTKRILAETEKKPVTFEKIARGTNDYFWYRRTVSEGTKGPVTYELMKRRGVLCKDGQPDRTVWLIVRRTLGEGAAYSYFISNVGRSARLKTFVRLSGVRWAVEPCFEEAKSDLGMDHYEVRKFPGWRYMYCCRDKNMKNEEKKGDRLAVNALQDERKLMEEELKISKEKYRNILESIEEAYFELDLSGNVTFLNKSAAKMLGYTLEEMIGKNYREYIPQQQRKLVTKIFNKIYRTGIPATVYDYQVITKDGNKIFRETSATLMQDSSGKAIGFRCVARDVTKRKSIEESLKRKDVELEIKSRSLAETNIALKVLLKQMEEEKLEFERTILSNIREIIMPYIEQLKASRLTDNQIVFVETINNNLINIMSPFLRRITLQHFNLTPKEFQVAVLVKEGRTTKEITNVLNISAGAVDFHRNRIRKKLGLNNKKVNLRSHLLSL